MNVIHRYAFISNFLNFFLNMVMPHHYSQLLSIHTSISHASHPQVSHKIRSLLVYCRLVHPHKIQIFFGNFRSCHRSIGALLHRPVVLNRGHASPGGRTYIFKGARALMCFTTHSLLILRLTFYTYCMVVSA